MFKSRKSHAAMISTGFRYTEEPRRSVSIQLDRLIPVVLFSIFAAFAAAYFAI